MSERKDKECKPELKDLGAKGDPKGGMTKADIIEAVAANKRPKKICKK